MMINPFLYQHKYRNLSKQAQAVIDPILSVPGDFESILNTTLRSIYKLAMTFESHNEEVKQHLISIVDEIKTAYELK